MIRKLMPLALIGLLLLPAGCGPIIAGTAAGVGVYSYYQGELKRTYPEDYSKTVDVCLASLEDLKITVEKKEGDGIQTAIKARQTNENEVIVKVINIAPKLTEVSVRTGIFGAWDKQVSELIHATIAKKIQP